MEEKISSLHKRALEVFVVDDSIPAEVREILGIIEKSEGHRAVASDQDFRHLLRLGSFLLRSSRVLWDEIYRSPSDGGFSIYSLYRDLYREYTVEVCVLIKNSPEIFINKVATAIDLTDAELRTLLFYLNVHHSSSTKQAFENGVASASVSNLLGFEVNETREFEANSISLKDRGLLKSKPVHSCYELNQYYADLLSGVKLDSLPLHEIMDFPSLETLTGFDLSSDYEEDPGLDQVEQAMDDSQIEEILVDIISEPSHSETDCAKIETEDKSQVSYDNLNYLKLHAKTFALALHIFKKKTCRYNNSKSEWEEFQVELQDHKVFVENWMRGLAESGEIEKIPVEKLALRLKMNEFEKLALLYSFFTSFPRFLAAEVTGHENLESDCDLGVSTLLSIIGYKLQKQLKCMKYLKPGSRLRKHRLVQLEYPYRSNSLLEANIKVDARIQNLLLGELCDFEEVIPGAELYKPSVDMEGVVLPKHQIEELKTLVSSHRNWIRARRNFQSERTDQNYGNATILLMQGSSGTGKTMLANALANHLGKRMLLVDYRKREKEGYRDLFREANLSDAVLFFDECHAIFDKYNLREEELLVELERFDGIVILATNRSLRLSEAFQRRITRVVEILEPGKVQRKRIWEIMIPQNVQMDKDVDLDALARDFELTGGRIQNAVQNTLMNSIDNKTLKVKALKMADLVASAKEQLINYSDEEKAFESVKLGMDQIVLDQELQKSIDDILAYEKSRKTIAQWNPGSHFSVGTGQIVLFHGPPGTGKTSTAHALAYQLGRPLKIVNFENLVSKYVGDTAKNIEQVFRTARANRQVLLIDEADAVLANRTSVQSSTDRYANLDVNVLLKALENFDGLAILTSNLADNLDAAINRRLRYTLEFKRPMQTEREALWKLLIPQAVPSRRIDFKKLAEFDLSGAQIKQIMQRVLVQLAQEIEEKPNAKLDTARLVRVSRDYLREQHGGERQIGFLSIAAG